MKFDTEIICPTCSGIGRLVITVGIPKTITTKINQAAELLQLHEKGYGLREIGRMLGIKNPATVAYRLKKAKELKPNHRLHE